MSTVPATAAPHPESTTARLRNLLIGALFAAVLLIPKLLRVRRNPSYWLTFRIFLGVAGAALVVLPLSLSNSWFTAPAGLAMFLAAILLPPAKPGTTRDDKARELGALVTVNGGSYESAEGGPVLVDLYVGPERISVLSLRYQALLSIPVEQISSVMAIAQSGGWELQIHWADQTAAFLYRGVFAEHLARVAESTVASVVPSPLPVLQRSRAAGA